MQPTRAHVVPYLQTYAALKIWVAGCATGTRLPGARIGATRGGGTVGAPAGTTTA